jgi:hypothetical protein
MPPQTDYELLIEGELVEPLLAMWSSRLDKIDRWGNRADRTSAWCEDLRVVYEMANQAHTDLTTLHIYQKRNPASSSKVQRQLQIATASHREANALYAKLLDAMSD